MNRLLGITRERVYSPGRVEDDAAILNQVAVELRARDADVTVVDGDTNDWPRPSPESVVFAMAQGPRALEQMRQWQARGIRVINCPEGILNCHRDRTVARLQQAAVGFPQTMLVDTAADGPPPPWADKGDVWLKRGDVHATDDGDVVRATNGNQVRAILDRMASRGIGRAAIQAHVEGTVVKFYGVRSGFFHCVPPPHGAAPDTELTAGIAEVARRAAEALEVEVFGGDCVVTAARSLHIIDLNDWPSYRACRAEAAKAIASYLIQQTQTFRGNA